MFVHSRGAAAINIESLQVVCEQQKEQLVDKDATDFQDHEAAEDASQGRALVPYTPTDQVSQNGIYLATFLQFAVYLVLLCNKHC